MGAEDVLTPLTSEAHLHVGLTLDAVTPKIPGDKFQKMLLEIPQSESTDSVGEPTDQRQNVRPVADGNQVSTKRGYRDKAFAGKFRRVQDAVSPANLGPPSSGPSTARSFEGGEVPRNQRFFFRS
jgi:hypothetical protein